MNKIISDTMMTALADAIRSKTGKSAKMTPAEMVDAIKGIETMPTPTTMTVNSTSTSALSISFSGLKRQPTIFSVTLCSQYTTAQRYVITSCAFDGTRLYNTTRYSRTGNNTDYTYVGTSFIWTYANGTLTIKSPANNSSGGVWCGGTYRLICV